MHGPQDVHGAPEGPSSWPWRSLLPALVVSLVVHGLLLFALRVQRDAHASRPVLVVTLTTASVERPAAAPQPPLPPPALPVPRPPLEPRPRAAVPTPAAAPPEPAPQPAEQAAARPDTSFQPPEEEARGPVPQGVPDVREIAPQLVGRRLQVSVWVDPSGAVQRAEVTPNELTPEQVSLLEQAIAQVRFTPARRQDFSAAAELRTLLCFDDAGQLDVASSQCWKPQLVEGR